MHIEQVPFVNGRDHNLSEMKPLRGNIIVFLATLVLCVCGQFTDEISLDDLFAQVVDNGTAATTVSSNNEDRMKITKV